MLIPVKIECECGQHYAFDHDGDGGQLAYSAIACPACGVDGTPAANAVIARGLQPADSVITIPPKPRARIHVATPARATQTVAAPRPAPISASRTSALRVGLVDPEQARIEARAKIFWGDATEDAVKHLMVNGFNHGESDQMVKEMLQERRQALRGIGVKKIVIGCLMMCVPIIAYSFFARIGFFPIKLFAIAVVVGLWGVWMVIKGIIMLVAPKWETGDVADLDGFL